MEIDCPIHGPSPVDWHHRVPRAYGGDDSPENVQAICRWCHRDHHRADYDIHYRGWLGLVDKITSDGIPVQNYMRSLQERIRLRIGEDAYRERMRAVRRGESPKQPDKEGDDELPF